MRMPNDDDFTPPQRPAPKINPERLEELEKDILTKVEKRAEIKKLEEQVSEELETKKKSGTIEQVFLFLASALLLIRLPFTHVVIAIVFGVLTIITSLIAGFTSTKQPISPILNLGASLIGLTIFEYSAIASHALGSPAFWFYQLLAFIFLVSTFFSARTYQKRKLE
jgi:hypothetical protein